MTWPGWDRRFGPARFTFLLVTALLGTAAAVEGAVTASVVSGQLRVNGDGAADAIRLLLSVDGLRVEVWNGNAFVTQFARASFTTILVDAGGGDDTVTIDETNGVFTDTEIATLIGGDGDDTIAGGGGAETIDGGPGNDDITGGHGIDTIHGGAGNDHIFWNANPSLLTPSDGNDIVDGEAGDDWIEMTGNDLAETYSLAPNGDRARVVRGGIQVSLGTVEHVLLFMEDGDDQFTVDPALTAPIVVHINGGGGNDNITGGPGDDDFTASSGNDTIHGAAGNDILVGSEGDDVLHGDDGDDTFYGRSGNDSQFGGPGNDRFVWLHFEDDDVIDGGPGVDTLEAAGDFPSENYNLQPNGSQIVLGINPGGASIAFTATERLDVSLRGGSDIFVLPPSLASVLTVTVHGEEGDDLIVGGAGDDVLDGGSGNDTINGGDGNDTIDGGPGLDAITGGNGNDLVLWAPSDGNDIAEGNSGLNVFRLVGNAARDSVRIEQNFPRITVSRGVVNQVGSETVDLGTFLRVEILMGGGGDVLRVYDGTQAILDRVTADMGDGDDLILSEVTAAPLVVDGGAGVDQLSFNAFNQSVHLQPGTIAIQNVVRVSHVNVEDISFLNIPGGLPAVTITTPTTAPAMTSTSAFVTLAGTVSDQGPIVSVTWANDRGGSGTAAGTSAWSVPGIVLQPGLNRITVSALDTNGNLAFDQIEVALNAFTYSLAEGATGTFFDLDVAIANPTTTPAPVTVTFLRQDGPPISQSMTLAPTSRQTIHVDDVPGLESQGGVSTVVTSTAAIPLVVERTMFWDASSYGSHGGTAVDGPRTRWLFAEGSEGFFHTFVLLANPGTTASDVTLTFLREGSTPYARVVTVPPNARVTVAANGIPEIVDRSFSIVAEATTPIIAERAMYFGSARLFDGGHESAGVPEGATSWFLAEGATGTFFTTFVLVGNPNPVAANVTFTFLTTAGHTVVRNKVVPANGRLTVNVALEDPILASAAVSTTLTADQPVIAERAMYWPGPPSTWAEAHNGFGATALGTKWALAEGRVGLDHAFQTYILLANPSSTTANVRITFLRADGTTVVKTFTVGPTSRFNVAVNTAAPELQNEAFGALIEVTNGVGISVERAMYSDALGQVWAAGTNALGTRLP